MLPHALGDRLDLYNYGGEDCCLCFSTRALQPSAHRVTALGYQRRAREDDVNFRRPTIITLCIVSIIVMVDLPAAAVYSVPKYWWLCFCFTTVG